MAIGPEEAFDPESFANTLWEWEGLVDERLKEHFDGSRDPIYIRLDKESKIFKKKGEMSSTIRRLLMRRYIAAGWIVRYQRAKPGKLFEHLAFYSPKVLHP